MEPPAIFEADALRDEKVKILQAIRPIEQTIRAQYEGYLDEPRVPQGSETATYAALQLFIDNWRWHDIPFYLRSGKSLKAKSTEISIEFKRVPHLMFPMPLDEEIVPNVISLCIQPDEGIHLRFQAKEPGAGMRTRTVDMAFNYTQGFDDDETALPDAYERLLLDALQGDASLFSRADEIELAWQLIDPIIEIWQQGEPPLVTYPPGSWGPPEAEAFLDQSGRRWYNGCGVG